MINILNKIQSKLKIKLKDKNLLTEALTHKSSNQKKNNEKLEFLGDRVIGLVLSKKLFDLYPNETEGVLDKRFSRLVNRHTCAEVALSISLQNFIIMGDSKKKITKTDQKILSDACEALIGAIYIDRGHNFTKDFILKLWRDKIAKSDITVLDSKTKLQEYSLKKYKSLPIYRLVSSKGPKHNPTFKVSVSIFRSKHFVGTGSSKQQAEQDSAKNLIKSLNIA